MFEDLCYIPSLSRSLGLVYSSRWVKIANAPEAAKMSATSRPGRAQNSPPHQTLGFFRKLVESKNQLPSISEEDPILPTIS